MYEFFPSLTRATHPTQLITPVTLDKHKLHCAAFSPICHFLPPRPKHLPQRHVLEYYHLFCIQYERPGFTLIQTTHKLQFCIFQSLYPLTADRGTKYSGQKRVGHYWNLVYSSFFSMSVMSVGLACHGKLLVTE